ncbi:MAG: DnaJ domain-containing protein [Anaerolineales bacterium]|nr:DnaJ domain-containing protein [Anaerolineales bacterium]
MPDHYFTLQVDRRAEPEVIAAAYRSLARKYHPDKTASAASTKRMQEINAAYEVLRDPAKRRAYDRANPLHACRVLWRDPDAMVWGGASDPEESTDWAHAYARRRSRPAPIPRKGFWERNIGCVLYLIFAAFVCWQVAATIVLKM